MPTVSVIIPTYNHRDYVVDALDSVLKQSYRDREIIVINDGSPDDTSAVLSPFVSGELIHYIEQPNAGQAAARNRGLAEARGEYVALLDDDDLWPRDKLEWQVAALQSTRAVAVGGLASESLPMPLATRQEGEPTRISRDELFCGPPFTSPGQALFRRDALVAAGGFDTTIWGADDWDLYLRLSERGDFMFIPRLSLFYRLHDANASRRLLKMHQNLGRCIQKNVRRSAVAKRLGHLQAGYYFQFRYSGQRLLRRMHPLDVPPAALSDILKPMWPGLAVSPMLTTRLGRELALRMVNRGPVAQRCA